MEKNSFGLASGGLRESRGCEYSGVDQDAKDEGEAPTEKLRTRDVGVRYEESDRWNALQRAWRTLSDPCRRMAYHWRAGIDKRTEQLKSELLAEIRHAHRVDELNMEVQYKEISERELKSRGLVIIQAWYG